MYDPTGLMQRGIDPICCDTPRRGSGMMETGVKDELIHIPDLRHRLRRLRWFSATFRAHTRAVAASYGIRFEIDEAQLTAAFLDWIEAVEAEKRLAVSNRADFVIFAAGLALRELIRRNPASVISSDPTFSQSKSDAIARFWPEGFLYTNYCFAVVSAVYQQEFGVVPALATCAEDLRTWWSYRENVAEMPGYAVAFFDRFLGAEPNWIWPDHAPLRQAIAAARAGAIANTAA
jgi:hypothetical protein